MNIGGEESQLCLLVQPHAHHYAQHLTKTHVLQYLYDTSMSVPRLPVLTGQAPSYSSRYGPNGPGHSDVNDIVPIGDGQAYVNDQDAGGLQLPQIRSAVSSPAATKQHPATSDGQAYFLRPDSMLKHYGTRLSAYEQKEITSYDEIYFAGLNAKKRQGSSGGSSANNNGFDDEQGSYINVIHDHLA